MNRRSFLVALAAIPMAACACRGKSARWPWRDEFRRPHCGECKTILRKKLEQDEKSRYVEYFCAEVTCPQNKGWFTREIWGGAGG
jgi:hypothetical protein